MASTKIPGKCDICTKKDGFKNHNLQRCRTCGLLVHETCYGMVTTTEKDPDWVCLACESLDWDPEERGGVRQIERPAECCFCSYSEGVHAMHPLYDTYGKAGKQIILPATDEESGLSDDTAFESGGVSTPKPRRLAWVHSLCAFYIGTYARTGGTVYACSADGSWGGEDDDDDVDSDEEEEFESDDESGKDKDRKKKGSESDDDGIDEGGTTGAHHFVINDDKESAIILNEFRRMKCTICGFHDKTGKSLKIALQCTAGDPDELREFAQRHSADASEPCYVSFHIGCARWMGDPEHPRVFYYPGVNPDADDNEEEEEFSDPVTCAYCDAHAWDVWANKKSKAGRSAKQQQAARMKAPPKGRTEARRAGSSTQAKKLQKDAATSPRLPPQAARVVTSSKHSMRAEPGQRRQAATSGTQSAAPRRSDAERWEAWFPQVKEDVVRVVREAQRKNNDVMEATSRRRIYWKETSALPKPEFKLLWDQVKPAVKDEVLHGSAAKAGRTKTVATKAVQKKTGVTKAVQTKADETKAVATKMTKAKGGHAKEPQAKADTTPGFAVESELSGNQETSPNPWAYLWVPNYEGKMFSFDEWDTIELVEPDDDAK